MRAYLVDSGCALGGKLVNDVERPRPRPGETLVKMLRIGICNTDLEMLSGYTMGFDGILGHEFLAEVEEVNGDDPRSLRKGQRVVGEINCHPLDACECRYCKKGGDAKRNHCANRSVLGIIVKDGTYCDYMVIPTENLIAVPDQICDQNAVFAEPLAAALRVVEQGNTKPQDRVAIIGDGKLGLLIGLVLIEKCSSITAFGHHADKLAILKKAGAEKVVVVKDDDEYKAYENEFDVVVEATGSSDGLKNCALITRPQGTVVLKSTCCGQGQPFNATQFVVKELRIQGSRCGDMEDAVCHLVHMDLTSLVTGVYDFDDIQKALEHASRKGQVKVQVTFASTK